MKLVSDGTRTYASKDIKTLTGLTPHVLGQWVQKGYLTGPMPGSGHPREWPLKAVLKAELMYRLTHVGFIPQAASRIADEMMLEPEADGVARVDLGHDLFLYQNRSFSYVSQVLGAM